MCGTLQRAIVFVISVAVFGHDQVFASGRRRYVLPKGDLPLAHNASYSEAHCNGSEISDNVTVQQVMHPCGSCVGKCGRTLALSDAVCVCDERCLAYADCCPDFAEACPSEHTRALVIVSRFLNHASGETPSVACARVSRNPVALVAGCPHDTNACITGQQPFDNIPLRDSDTGLDFINARCAVCNGITSGTPWATELGNCPPKQQRLTSFSDIAALAEQPDCMVIIRLPESYHTCGRSPPASCPPACPNKPLVEGCFSGVIQTVGDMQGRLYRNKYCAMCQSDMDTSLPLQCMHPNPGFRTDLNVPSFALLFRFDPDFEGGMTLDCDVGEVYVSHDIGCRGVVCLSGHVFVNGRCVESPPALCPEGMEFINNSCQVVLEDSTDFKDEHWDGSRNDSDPALTTELYGTNSSLSSTEMIPGSGDSCLNGSRVIRIEVRMRLSKANATTIESRVAIFMKNTCTVVENYTQITYNNSVLIQCSSDAHYYHSSTQVLFINTIESESSINIQDIRSTFVELTLNATAIFDDVIQEGAVDYLAVDTKVLHSALSLQCPHVSFHGDEFRVVDTDTIILTFSGLRVTSGDFLLRGSELQVCVRLLKQRPKKTTTRNNVESVLGVLTVACMSMSAVCLTLRVILQFYIPTYHTFAMRLQCSFSFALLISICFFLSGIFLTKYRAVCQTVAILMHCSFLASFVWMSILSADLYKVLSSVHNLKPSSGRAGHRALITYQVLGWGVPSAIMAVSLAVEKLAELPLRYKPQYGTSACWLSQSGYSVLIYFGCPVFATIIFNLVMFALTSVSLSKAFRQRDRIVASDKTHFKVYAKLFIVMGVSYTLLLITPFVDHFALWVCIIVLNASQGLYIGIAFVFTKEIWSYFFGRIKLSFPKLGADGIRC